MKSGLIVEFTLVLVVLAVVLTNVEKIAASPTFLVSSGEKGNGVGAVPSEAGTGKPSPRFFFNFFSCPPKSSIIPGITWTSLWCIINPLGTTTTAAAGAATTTIATTAGAGGGEAPTDPPASDGAPAE